LITGIQPIHFGHGLERLGGRRLYELPWKAGFTERPTSETSLNACPHPLA
jgi:ribosomal protein S12 methylthiotransferase accessory factor